MQTELVKAEVTYEPHGITRQRYLHFCSPPVTGRETMNMGLVRHDIMWCDCLLPAVAGSMAFASPQCNYTQRDGHAVLTWVAGCTG